MKLKQKKNKKITWDKKLTTSCQVLWYHCEITVNSEIVTLLDEGIFNNGGLTLALNLLIHTKYLKWKNEWPENKKNYFLVKTWWRVSMKFPVLSWMLCMLFMYSGEIIGVSSQSMTSASNVTLDNRPTVGLLSSVTFHLSLVFLWWALNYLGVGLASLVIHCKSCIFSDSILGFCVQGGDPTGTGMGE